ncbi:hypothetical protein B0H13DRAFT_1986720 [Mycena leptocephala]|nr:hypothetical protein B0H13DRAFT_1986720 [Mycena leptocephala]
MKFTKPTISRTPARSPASGLRPLVLVDRMNQAQEVVPVAKKKRGNPATRMLRLLGLKKKKEKLGVHTDYVFIEKSYSAPSESSPPYVVPQRCGGSHLDCRSTPRPLPARPASSAVRSSDPKDSNGAMIYSRPSLQFGVPPTNPHPPLLLPALSQCSRPTQSPIIHTEQEVSPLEPGAGWRVTASRAVADDFYVAPSSVDVVHGLRPFLLRPGIPTLSTPPPLPQAPAATSDVTSTASQSQTAPPTPSAALVVPTTVKTSRQSRIPVYVGWRASRPSTSSGFGCAICGSPGSTTIRPLSDVSTQTAASEVAASLLSTSGGALDLKDSTRKATVHFAAQTDPEPERAVEERIVVIEASKVTAEFAVQTDREESACVASKQRSTESSQPDLEEGPTSMAVLERYEAGPPSAALSREAKSMRSGLIAALKVRHGKTSASSSDVSAPSDDTPKEAIPAANSWNRVKRDSTGLLEELKDRLARHNTHATTPSPPASTTQPRSTAPHKFPTLNTRRRVNKENAEPESELLQLFRRKASGTSRAPFGVLDTNAESVKSADRDQPTTFGARKLRRIVVPPVAEGSVPSRDPRIQSELDRLRAQGKVGRGGVGAGAGVVAGENLMKTKKERTEK